MREIAVALGHIHQGYAGEVDDARLAAACASGARTASGLAGAPGTVPVYIPPPRTLK